MNFLILSIVIFGVAATPISTRSNNQKIIGGFDAYAGQFPYQASIRHSKLLVHLCGGSIISNQWILTSAACSGAYQSNKLKVVVGSIYLNSGGTSYDVLISLKHPQFNQKFLENDIGLIRVNGQISYNDFVRPIPLSSDSTSIGLPLTISSWGLTNISAVIPSNTLQYLIIKSNPQDECQKLLNPLGFPLFDTQLCTYSTNGQGLCSADTGSPLVYNGQQHAVVSLPLYCLYSYPDVHTRVASFRSWIKDITNV